MEIIDRAPEDRPLVVRLSRQRHTSEFATALSAVLAVMLLTLLGVGIAATVGAGAGWWILLGLMLAGCVALLVIALRDRSRFASAGPVLAADATGVWLRVDRGRRALYLEWPEIEQIRVQNWRPTGSRGLPVMCIDAPTVAERVRRQPGITSATPRAQYDLGTPFILTDRRVDTDLGEILNGLHRLAPTGLVRAHDPWQRD